MSDEPLYCEACGEEECCCDLDSFNVDPRLGRHERHCFVCGVIPDDGKECRFYQVGGNATGCIGRGPT